MTKLKVILLNNRGFTIIEALIVVAIFGTIGIISADLLSRTFQGNNKVKLITSLKQNGQAALSSIEETIKYSDDIICPTSSSLSPKIVVVADGVYTRFEIATSYIAKDNPVPQNANDTQLCTDNLSSDKTFLIHQGSVVINNFGFTVNEVTGKNSSVGVQFDLSSSSSDSSFATQITPVSFQTTVQLK